MAKFRLSEEDAARLDCPRDVEFREDRIMGREAIALSRIGWSMERLYAVVERGTPVVDGAGNAMFEVDENGEPKLDDWGKPIRLVAVDPEAALVMVWLAVRRAKGVDVPWPEFDVDLMRLESIIGDDEEAPAAPGKARTRRAPASKTTTRGTRRR